MPARTKNKAHRDVVHDYIYVTPLEEYLIDRPDFQRLRHIRQNSCAYKTFSGNHLERFSHSLGVMHLGGQMFSNALRNAEQDVLQDFSIQILKIVKSKASSLSQTWNTIRNRWLNDYGNIGRIPSIRIFNFSQTTIEADGGFKDYEFALNVVWQSVRLCCAFHDLGHLPFSHLFEDAVKDLPDLQFETIGNLNDQIQSTYSYQLEHHDKLHEVIGIYLFTRLDSDGEFNNFQIFQLCKALAVDIFLAARVMVDNTWLDQNDEHKERIDLFQRLYNIISGEIDADRLDYTMRDSFYSGIDTGDFDVKRLLNNVKLVKNEENKFEIVLMDRALSSIEQFFDSRFRLYKYLIFHHNVSRFNGILKEIIKSLIFELNETPNGEIAGIWKNDFMFLDSSHTFLSIEKWSLIDDGTLRSVIKKVMIHLEQQASNSRSADKEALLLLIKTFLYRQTWNIASLWKRDNGAKYFIKSTKEYIQENLDASTINREKILDNFQEWFINLSIDYSSNLKEILSRKLVELDPPVTLIYSRTNPPTYDKLKLDQTIRIETKNLNPEEEGTKFLYLWEASSDLASLEGRAAKLVPHQFALVASNIKHSDGGALLKNCWKIIQKEIGDFYISEQFTDSPENDTITSE